MDRSLDQHTSRQTAESGQVKAGAAIKLFDEAYAKGPSCPTSTPGATKNELFTPGITNSGEPVAELPSKVKYKDGTSSEFSYNDSGTVMKYKDREGRVWLRDDANQHVFTLQDKKHGNQQQKLEVIVHADGSVQTESADRVIHNYSPDGHDSKYYPNLEITDIKRLADKNWNKIDADKNGTLSRDEIDMAVNDQSFKSEDAEFVVALKRSVASPSLAAGVPKKQIEAVSDIADSVVSERKVWSHGLGLFTTVDADHNNALSGAELQKTQALYSKDPCVKDYFEALQKMSAIYKSEIPSDAAASKEFKGLVYNDLSKLNTTYNGASKDTQSLIDGTLIAGESASLLSHATEKLYGDGSKEQSLVPAAVAQGSSGTCVLLAGISSLAAVDPQKLSRMIKRNSDGTINVSFPSGAKATVEAPTEAQLALYTHDAGYGTWPAVLEKAYGELRTGGTGIIPSEGGTNGDRLSAGLEMLTGKSYGDADLNRYTDAKLGELLERLNTDKIPLALAKLSFDSTKKYSELPSSHAYSIIGYDQATQMVTVRNPWGKVEPKNSNYKPLDGTDDGVFKVKVSDLRNIFDQISQPNF